VHAGVHRARATGHVRRLVRASLIDQNVPMTTLRRRFAIIPLWVSYPLMMLGLVAPVIAVSNRDWDALAAALIFAAVLGTLMKFRYRSRLVERTKDRVVVETIRQRRAAEYRPLTRRAWVLVAVAWVALFIAIAFLPDDQAVGADFLLVIVTVVWIAYRVGQRRGASTGRRTTAEPTSEVPPQEAETAT
jgi:hypothetical protein